MDDKIIDMDKQLEENEYVLDPKIRGLIDGYELFFDNISDVLLIADYCKCHDFKYDIYIYTKFNKSEQFSIKLRN